MLDALRFVQGAIAVKNFEPILSHVAIANGKIKSYNGTISLCSPIDTTMTVTPQAAPFIKAIRKCRGQVSMAMSPSGRLAVRSGSFKAFIETLDDVFPGTDPEGDMLPVEGSLLQPIETCSSFIAADASRPWARGILFRGNSCYATNNICLVERWLGTPFPVEVNVPIDAITELLRIDENPMFIQVSDKSLTFHFSGGRWLKTRLYDLTWPDVNTILDVENEAAPWHDGFFDALQNILPFVDPFDKVHIQGNILRTHLEDEVGALETLEGAAFKSSCFNIRQLLKLEDTSYLIDLNLYPKPCIFYGEMLRGAIIGIRN